MLHRLQKGPMSEGKQMQKPQKRWMKSVVAAAKRDQSQLPFQREYRRAVSQATRGAYLRKSA